MAPRFANILLAGPCNQRCPHCIGKKLGAPFPPNLDRFPLKNFARFTTLLRELGIRQVSLTGTDTDPLLYRHVEQLLAALRQAVPGVQISLHSNGLLALARLSVVNQFDRVALSLPSLRPATCRALTGSSRVLDLEKIAAAVSMPLKISMLLTPANLGEVEAVIARCHGLGIRRLVLRQLHGTAQPLDPLPGRTPARWFAGQPVFDVDGVEVTVWDFASAQLDCVNLYSDGTLSRRYLLQPPSTAEVFADAA